MKKIASFAANHQFWVHSLKEAEQNLATAKRDYKKEAHRQAANRKCNYERLSQELIEATTNHTHISAYLTFLTQQNADLQKSLDDQRQKIPRLQQSLTKHQVPVPDLATTQNGTLFHLPNEEQPLVPNCSLPFIEDLDAIYEIVEHSVTTTSTKTIQNAQNEVINFDHEHIYASS